MTENEQPSSNDLQEESKSSRRINWFLSSGQSLANYTIQRPFSGFVAVLIIFNLTFMLVWSVPNCGLPQPTELGL